MAFISYSRPHLVKIQKTVIFLLFANMKLILRLMGKKDGDKFGSEALRMMAGSQRDKLTK
jgi:hypothetical protein